MHFNFQTQAQILKSYLKLFFSYFITLNLSIINKLFFFLFFIPMYDINKKCRMLFN